MARRSVALAAMISMLAGSTAAGPLPGSPLAEIACSRCHLESSVDGLRVPSADAHLIMEAQEILCRDCHSGFVESGHPSGFIPDRPLPPEYPLDFTGFFTCSSCHWIHQPRHGALRNGDDSSDSCLGCHDY